MKRSATIYQQPNLASLLEKVRVELQMSWEADLAIGEIHTTEGTLGVDYGFDEEFGDYAIVGFNLPSPWHGEIDDGTYGSLQGFRVYRCDLDD